MDINLLEKKLEKTKHVLYIKLGTKKVGWEKDCIENGKISVGFQMHIPEVLEHLKREDYDSLKTFWGKKGRKQATQTTFVNQMRRFYEDNGNTLWITFANEKMYYCFSNGGQIDNTQEPTFRKTDENGWMCEDINGNELSISSISSALTKTRATQNTIPNSFSEDIKEYIKRKIRGLPFEPLQRAILIKNHKDLEFDNNIMKQFDNTIRELIKSLHQDDFELLIEIIFSKTEWLRVSSTGGNQKTIDFAVRDFQSETEAFVQVKTEAKQKGENGFEDYVKRLINSPYKKMFFVYHSGSEIKESYIKALLTGEEKKVEVWDLDRVFREVSKYKLHDWILYAARRCEVTLITPRTN